MNKTQVLKFIGKRRAEKIAELDVYMINGVWCIDAIAHDEFADRDGCGTFVMEGYDETPREIMECFRAFIDELEAA